MTSDVRDRARPCPLKTSPSLGHHVREPINTFISTNEIFTFLLWRSSSHPTTSVGVTSFDSGFVCDFTICFLSDTSTPREATSLSSLRARVTMYILVLSPGSEAGLRFPGMLCGLSSSPHRASGERLSVYPDRAAGSTQSFATNSATPSLLPAQPFGAVTLSDVNLLAARLLLGAGKRFISGLATSLFQDGAVLFLENISWKSVIPYSDTTASALFCDITE
ncbi:hypothetical protein J6590_018092 [Homalodisca vitripennis]|nr:hypothetical protein J6590_018092 [Homalodisca vitripennis]